MSASLEHDTADVTTTDFSQDIKVNHWTLQNLNVSNEVVQGFVTNTSKMDLKLTDINITLLYQGKVVGTGSDFSFGGIPFSSGQQADFIVTFYGGMPVQYDEAKITIDYN